MRISLSYLFPVLLLLMLLLALQPARAGEEQITEIRPSDAFVEPRAAHREKIIQEKESYDESWRAGEADRAAATESRDAARITHQEGITATKSQWESDWDGKSNDRAAAVAARDERRATHQSGMTENPERWWTYWRSKNP